MEDGGSQIITGFILYFIFMILEFFLSAFAAALDEVSENELQQSEENGRNLKWIRRMRENPERLENTIWFSVISFLVLTGYFPIHWFANLYQGELHIAALAGILVLSIFVFCIFGIGLPKVLGTQFYKTFLFRSESIVKGMVSFCMPATLVMDGSVHVLARLFGINTSQLQDDVTEEEIISMVNEGHEQGVLEANEAEMINNIFEFGDKTAQDIMTHRKNIVGVDGNLNLKDAISFMLDEANSRFPVFEGSIDNITGIIHLKDAMKYHTLGQHDDWLIKDIPGLIRPAVFIPETRKISPLFRSMQSKKLQMVVVADEYGQTAGLVALEDILEEIVGNIQDEYDEDETHIIEQPDGSYFMEGMTPLEEIEEKLGIKIQLKEDIETLNGYLISKLDKIPSEDDHSVIEDMGYAFRILSVANNTIEKVKVTKLSSDSEEVSSEK